MTNPSPDTPILPHMRRPTLNPYLLTIGLLAMVVLGGALVLRFAEVQQNRETMQWQNKLNLIADSRAADIGAWLDHHLKELETVAANPSLQLYLSELATNVSAPTPAPTPVPAQATPFTPAPDAAKAHAEEPSQTVYLRALLSITADRMGFTDKPSNELKSINADVQKASGAGLAILDNSGKFLVSTNGMTELSPDLAKKVADAPKNQSSLIDLYMSESNQTRIGFIVPIYAIQGEASTTEQIGTLVGIKNIDSSFYNLLHQPGMAEKTLDVSLLRKDGPNVVFLSSNENHKDAAATLAVDTPNLDAAYAVTMPGTFASKIDRFSHATLMTSRVIPRSPWIVMVNIDRDQALAESTHWQQQMEAMMFFALLSMIGGVVAVWFYGTSRRSRLLSLETGRLAMRLAAKEKLLRVVANNQLEPILIVDNKNVAHFGNEKAAHAFHMPADALAGKSLTALMGTALAFHYTEANWSALVTGKPVLRTWRTGAETNATVIQSQHIPLPHIPMDQLTSPTPGVLIIDQDVSGVVHERERRVRAMQNIVNTLVHLMDKRDPYAANHSMAVALVAQGVAMEMQLDTLLVDTAEIAGKLMNVGKIAVPSKLLVKETTLADDEIKFIRASLQNSVSLLEGIEFDGPVADTLRQMQERYDGTGPLGLKGEDILVTARVIAVANAYVGMVSARSYHVAMSSEEAAKNLMNGSGAQFDPRAIIALANFMTNKNGKVKLAVLLARST